jgi:hypothetical protein
MVYFPFIHGYIFIANLEINGGTMIFMGSKTKPSPRKRAITFNTKELLVELEEWMLREEVTRAELGVILGYASSNTIYNWFLNQKIPGFQRAAIKKLLSGSKDDFR